MKHFLFLLRLRCQRVSLQIFLSKVWNPNESSNSAVKIASRSFRKKKNSRLEISRSSRWSFPQIYFCAETSMAHTETSKFVSILNQRFALTAP